MARSRNMNIYIELTSLEQMQDFIQLMKSMGVQIYDVEIDWQGTR